MAPVAICFLVLICGVMPWLSIKSARAVNAGAKAPTFTRHLVSALCVQAYMLFIALYTAYQLGIELFPRPHFEWRFVGVGAAALAVMLGTAPIRRRFLSEELKRRALLRRPRTGTQMLGWTLLSVVAGFGEEIVYRGVLFQILYYKLNSWWPCVLIASAAFAAAHMIQGRWIAGWIFAFSIGFHAIVWYCSDLYTAMIVHFLYDLLVGLIFGLFRRERPAQQAPA